MDYRVLSPGQVTQVKVASLDGREPRLLFESDEILLEAPNWTLDGSALILNGEGRLWRLDIDSGALTSIPIQDVPALNNDHVLAPDGRTVFVSANDWHLYRAPLNGGKAERITREDSPYLHFLHGVSPDGVRLAFVGLEPEGDNPWARANIFSVPATGGRETRLTDTPSPADGCEFSPDGDWIYFNTEQFSDAPGHAQIARMRTDGSGVEQLTFDDSVNWFPHLAPNSLDAVYLSFPPGTTGHPADLPVEIKHVRVGEWTHPTTVASFMGGQGTINVNSWSPASDQFAFVAYPSAASGLG